MFGRRSAAGLGAVVVAALLAACGGSNLGGNQPTATGDVAAGERAYGQTCAACHGAAARGSGRGPALVDRVYEPSHHDDTSFLRAVRNGVPQHHWSFGDMAPQPGVSETAVADIVAYVRSLQVEAGIR